MIFFVGCCSGPEGCLLSTVCLYWSGLEAAQNARKECRDQFTD